VTGERQEVPETLIETYPALEDICGTVFQRSLFG